MVIGLVFVLNTLLLGYTYNEQRLQSAVDLVQPEALVPSTPVSTQTQTAPAAPDAPAAPINK